jgi:hypothetical protein
MNRSKPLANAVLAAASDSDPYVQFQASLTLGDLKDPRVLATMAQLAHRSSSDAWFRAAILSSVADSASPFFHVVLAQGKSGTDQQLLIQLSALIGARQNKNEVAQWFAALTKLNQPDKFLEGLTHGLRMANARNLQVPGAEHALTRFARVQQRTGSARGVGSVAVFRAGCPDTSSQSGCREFRFVASEAGAGHSRSRRRAF